MLVRMMPSIQRECSMSQGSLERSSDISAMPHPARSFAGNDCEVLGRKPLHTFRREVFNNSARQRLAAMELSAGGPLKQLRFCVSTQRHYFDNGSPSVGEGPVLSSAMAF